MGLNFRQKVSDTIYFDFVDGLRSVFVMQSNEYYVHKLRGKKYFWVVNEELPDKLEARFMIESVEKGYVGSKRISIDTIRRDHTSRLRC